MSMMNYLSYGEAIDKADHLIALGETTVYVRDDSPPWHIAETVEVGSSYRLSGPRSVYFIGKKLGLTFKWSVDFESRDANGRGVSLFDRDRLREVMLKLPDPARLAFAELLENQVLPPLRERTAEIRGALNNQWDSEDCVRGLIAYARDATAGHPGSQE